MIFSPDFSFSSSNYNFESIVSTNFLPVVLEVFMDLPIRSPHKNHHMIINIVFGCYVMWMWEIYSNGLFLKRLQPEFLERCDQNHHDGLWRVECKKHILRLETPASCSTKQYTIMNAGKQKNFCHWSNKLVLTLWFLALKIGNNEKCMKCMGNMDKDSGSQK